MSFTLGSPRYPGYFVEKPLPFIEVDSEPLPEKVMAPQPQPQLQSQQQPPQPQLPQTQNKGLSCKKKTALFQTLALIANMTPRERKVFSQNHEDGLIEAIFEVLGTTNKYYVEFGVETCSECNTKNLWKNFGWTGTLLDGSPRVTGDTRVIYQ